MGEGSQIGSHIQQQSPLSWDGDWGAAAWHQAVFKDPNFYREYIKNLELFSKNDFLNAFIDSIYNEFSAKQRILHNDFPLFHFDPIPLSETKSAIHQAGA